MRGDYFRPITGNVTPYLLRPALHYKTSKPPEIDVISLAHVIFQDIEKTFDNLLNINLF